MNNALRMLPILAVLGLAGCDLEFGPSDSPLNADAGADQVIPIESELTLSATANGGSPPYLYRWTLETQPNEAEVELDENATESTLQVGLLTVGGRYVFRVRVTDQKGQTDTSFVAVNVGGDLPLSASASEPLRVIGETAELDAAIDTNTAGIESRSFEWSVIRGDAELSATDIRDPEVTILAAETVQLRVAVSAVLNGEERFAVQDVYVIGISDKTPRVVIENDGGVDGDIVLELLADESPITVANFLRYVDDDFYDGLVWHRVISDFVIQTGGFEREGDRLVPRTPVRSPIESEADNDETNVRGTVSMALRGNDADSATSQFFINVDDNPDLDEGNVEFTVFARVVEGLDIVDEIAEFPTGSENGLEDVPSEDIVMEDIRRVESPDEPNGNGNDNANENDNDNDNGNANDNANENDNSEPEVSLNASADDPLAQVGDSVQLTAALTGLDEDNALFEWRVTSGQATLASSAAPTTTATIDGAETAVFEVSVSSLEDEGISLATAEVAVVGVDGSTPQVLIENTGAVSGDIVLELLTEAAPGTVANFLRYVDEGFFDGIVWHRVVNDFVIQGGAYEREGGQLVQREGIRPPIASEANNGESNVRGTVAMALRGTDADSATNQFFINLDDNPELDDGNPPFTVFARVVSGLGVVDEIAALEVGNDSGLTDVPLEDVVMQEVRRRGEDEPPPQLATFQETSSTDTERRFFHRAGRLNSGLVMVTGGLTGQLAPPSLVALDSVSFYDPATDAFQAVYEAPDSSSPTTIVLLTPRSSHTQTTLQDGRVLITGGDVDPEGTDPGDPTDTTEIFDPQSGAMTAGPPMEEARSAHTANLLPDGRVAVVGGRSWQLFLPETDAWSDRFNLSATSRSAHAAVVLEDFGGAVGDTRVLVIAGSGPDSDTMELLNPEDGASILLETKLPDGVDDVAAAAFPDGRVLVVGGQLSNGNTTSAAFIIDPVMDTLVRADALPERADGISDHQIAAFGRYIAIFGGEQQVDGEDTELDYYAIFDTEEEIWVEHDSMRFVHDDFASVMLADDSLLLIGGGVPLLGEEVPSDTAEVFTLSAP